MACIVHMSVPTHTTARCSVSLFGFCPRCLPVLTWTNPSACGCLLAPQGGITLTTRVFRSQHYTLSSSYKLVRAPRHLCRNRPPHGSHMVQRLHPAHRLPHSAISPQVQTGPTRTVTSDLMSATLAEAATQLSFAAFMERCISVSAPPPPPLPPHLWLPPRRLHHTSLSLRTFLRNARSRSSLSDVSTRVIPRGPWLHLLRMMFSALRVLDQSLRYFLTWLCRRLCTASHPTMRPPNSRSRSSFSGVFSPMTLWIALTSTTR